MIDNYNGWCIGECIGSGSFGKVYRIYKEDFGHTYEAALKVMELPQSNSELMSLCSEGMSYEQAEAYYKDVIADMGKEFALMSDLKGHSHIVSYEDHSIVPKENEFGWNIYIKMELLTPMFDYIRDHELHINDAITIGIHICKALEICASRKIIHRDIKPENIFVSKSGDYKLGDFGIARELDKTTGNLSQKGTKNYMAPEVFRGTKYDATVDIYSLGIVLYRLLNNNRLPFLPPSPVQVRYSDYEKAMHMRLNNELIPPPCNASPDLAEIILKAISYFPERRYQDPSQMRMELEKLLQANQKSTNNDTISTATQNNASTFNTNSGSLPNMYDSSSNRLNVSNNMMRSNTASNTYNSFNSSNSVSTNPGGETIALNFNHSNTQYDPQTRILNTSSGTDWSTGSTPQQLNVSANDYMYSSSDSYDYSNVQEEDFSTRNRIRAYIAIGVTTLIVVIIVLFFTIFQLASDIEPATVSETTSTPAQTILPVPTVTPTLEPTSKPTPTPTKKATKKPAKKPATKAPTHNNNNNNNNSSNSGSSGSGSGSSGSGSDSSGGSSGNSNNNNDNDDDDDLILDDSDADFSLP